MAVGRRFTVVLISSGLCKGNQYVIHQMKVNIFLYLMILNAYQSYINYGKSEF